MSNVSRAMLRTTLRAMLFVSLLVTLLLVGMATAETAEKRAKAKAAPVTPAAHGKANACGCYKDAAGACLCGKKAKCGCPGECEPRACAEKDARDREKEIKAETKRAQEAERKQKATASKPKIPEDDKAAEKSTSRSP